MGDCILIDQKILSYEECKNFSLPEGSRATYEEIDMGKFVPKTDSPDENLAVPVVGRTWFGPAR